MVIEIEFSKTEACLLYVCIYVRYEVRGVRKINF